MVVSNEPWSEGPVPDVCSIVCHQVLAPHTPWGTMALHAFEPPSIYICSNFTPGRSASQTSFYFPVFKTQSNLPLNQVPPGHRTSIPKRARKLEERKSVSRGEGPTGQREAMVMGLITSASAETGIAYFCFDPASTRDTNFENLSARNRSRELSFMGFTETCHRHFDSVPKQRNTNKNHHHHHHHHCQPDQPF